MNVKGYDENLSMLNKLYPDRIVLSLTECGKALGIDYRTVKDLCNRKNNPLPCVRLTEGEKSRLGVPIVFLAQWLCRKEYLCSKK